MNKIVVFDLDETLGYFVQFGIFWKTLCQYLDNIKIKIKIKKQLLFNALLDLYPEFIRPGILSILYYLKYKISSFKKTIFLSLVLRRGSGTSQ